MQVRKVTNYEWVPVPVVLRNVPQIVPMITCDGGRWGVVHRMIRCTSEAILPLPFPRAKADCALHNTGRDEP